ncbi:MAG: nickel pincer cofactor biosynthesis protein LarB [Chloroflexia bacterium]
MSPEQLRKLLGGVQSGDVSIEAAFDRLKKLPYDDIGFARIDNHRALRTGFPEVILCAGKLPEQVAAIAGRMAGQGVPVIGTRCTLETFAAVRSALPDAEYHADARMFVVPPDPETLARTAVLAASRGPIAVLTGGTSDLPVAEEAALTAEILGNRVLRICDVGVAGLHRLLSRSQDLADASVVVVVAGMEGALVSVVAGLVAAPLIAVPTSVGYGASFGGLAALLAMLNSCAPGVAVVNIDNGFGAGYMAAKINRVGEARP